MASLGPIRDACGRECAGGAAATLREENIVSLGEAAPYESQSPLASLAGCVTLSFSEDMSLMIWLPVLPLRHSPIKGLFPP